MAKDFRAGQIRTTQIIASGSTLNKPSLLIASASSIGVDFDGSGIDDTDLLHKVGLDVFLFVSGASGSAGTETQGTTLFGGDVVVSGTAFVTVSGSASPAGVGGANTQVQFNDAGAFAGHAGLAYTKTTQELGIYGGISGSGGAHITGSSFNVDGSSATVDAVKIAASDAAGGIDIDAGTGGIAIDATGDVDLGTANSGVAVNIGHTTSEVTVNDNLTVTGDLTVNGTTTTIDTTNLSIEDPLIQIAAGAVSSNQNGGIAIGSGSTAAKQALVLGRVANDTWGVGRLDIEDGELAGGDVTGMVLTSLRASEFQIGSGTPVLSSSDGASIDLISAGGAAKIRIIPGTGGMGIGNSGGPMGISGSDVRFGTTSLEFGSELPPQPGDDSYFFVSGVVGSKDSSDAGSSVFGGDVIVSGSVTAINGLSGSLTQLADGSPYLVQGSNVTITSESNGAVTIAATDTDTDTIATGTFNVPAPSEFVTTASVSFAGGEGNAYTADSAGQDAYFFVSGAIGTKDGTTGSIAVFGGDVYTSGTLYASTSLFIGAADLTEDGDGDLTITAGRVVFSPSESDTSAFQVVTNGAAGLQLAAGSGGLGLNSGTGILTVTSSHVVVGSQSDEFGDTPPSPGDDTSFFVSGTLNSKDTSIRGTAAFGGDVGVSGTLTAELGLSGSLTQLEDGTPYLIQGANITITSESNGAVTITGAAGGAAGAVSGTFNEPSAANQITTASVSFAGNEGLTYTAGTIGEDVFFFASGTIGAKDSEAPGIAAFGGDLVASGAIVAEFGLSGSLTQLEDGTPYLVQGANITITSASNGAVTITGAAGGAAGAVSGTFNEPSAANQVTTASVSFAGNEGLIYTPLSVGEDTFHFVSGAIGRKNDGGYVGTAVFGGDLVSSGAIVAEFGLSGSLTQLEDGTPYLVQGANITITSESNGAVTITGAAGGAGGAVSGTFNEPAAGEQVTTASVSFAGNEGLTYTPLSIGEDTFHFVSGAIGRKNDASYVGTSVFGGDLVSSGAIVAELGLSGSLTQLEDGTPYLVQGANITITSESNGAVTITGAAGGAGGAVSGTFNEPAAGEQVTTGSVSLAGNKGLTYGAISVGEDTFFFVSGTIDGKGDAAAATVSTFGGDVVVSGTLTAETGISGSLTKLEDGTSYLVEGSNVTITSGANGSVTIASTGGGAGSSFWESNLNDSIYVTGSVIMAGSSGFVEPGDVGTDAYNYISGTFGDKDTATPGVTVINGDTVISGAIYGGYATPVGGNLLDLTSDLVEVHAADSGEAGLDTSFLVSGTIDSAGSSTRGTAVFTGDVVISGTLNAAGGSTGGQYGGIYIPENASGQTIVDGVPEIVDFNGAGGLNMSSSLLVTPDAANNKITVGQGGAYSINFGSSFSGANNAEYIVQVRVNNVPQDHMTFTRLMNSMGDIGSATRSGISVLSEDDVVELWVEGDTTTVTFVSLALWVHKLS
jgi:hypothetical protein